MSWSIYLFLMELALYFCQEVYTTLFRMEYILLFYTSNQVCCTKAKEYTLKFLMEYILHFDDRVYTTGKSGFSVCRSFAVGRRTA
jgi:hypothetical protein